MASSVVGKNTLCIKCGNKGGGIFMCHGCGQSFCWKHTGEHRQELSSRMDTIGQDHDLLQRDIKQKSEDHPLFLEIDQWEKKSIFQIQKVASTVRVDLQKKLLDTKDRLQILLSNITQEIRSSREKEDFSEIDFVRWNETLEKIRQHINKPLKIRTIFDEQMPPIQMIKIQSEATIVLEQNKIDLDTPRIETGFSTNKERMPQTPSSYDFYPQTHHQEQRLSSIPSASSAFRPRPHRETNQESQPQASSILSRPAQKPYQETRLKPQALSTQSQPSQKYLGESRPQVSNASSGFSPRTSHVRQQKRHEPRALLSSTLGQRRQLRRSHST